MVKTRRGVYLDLRRSEYRYKTADCLFFFSSELYLEKFINERYDYTFYMRDWIKRKFGMCPAINTFADICLYTKIEKRGFYIQIEGIEYTKPEDLDTWLLVGKNGRFVR